VRLVLDTVSAFQKNECSLMAAGLAYYGLISVSPVFVVGVAVLGVILGREEAQQAVLHRVGETLGTDAAETIAGLVRSFSVFSGGAIASLIAAGVLFYGATRVFAALQSSMEIIWEVPRTTSVGQGILHTVRSRLVAFAMVLMLGGVILATMLLETIGSTVEKGIEQYTALDPDFGSIGTRLAAVLVRALGLAVLYRTLPACKIAWRDVLPAGLLTAILLGVGHTLFGLYVSHSGIKSAYGAAGSIIVLLFSFYSAAFVVLFGAQFAKTYTARHTV
jgi:membrane protein